MFIYDKYEKEIIDEAKKKTEIAGRIKTKEDLIYIIEELLLILKNTEEKYNKLKQDMEDNYRPIPLDSEEMYGS